MQQTQIILHNSNYLYRHMDEELTIKMSLEKQFEMLFFEQYEPLVRYAFTMLKDRDEAEDIVQSSFYALWKDINKINLDKEIKSYLYKAVYFKCMNTFQRQKVKSKYLDYLTKTDTTFEHDMVVHHEIQSAINKTIEDLPEQCKRIFSMSRFEMKKYNEIAEELSLSPKTVENQMGKALKILRNALSEFLYFFFLTLTILLQ